MAADDESSRGHRSRRNKIPVHAAPTPSASQHVFGGAVHLRRSEECQLPVVAVRGDCASRECHKPRKAGGTQSRRITATGASVDKAERRGTEAMAFLGSVYSASLLPHWIRRKKRSIPSGGWQGVGRTSPVQPDI